jgi:predicted PurR-regulated permease PerM
MRQAEERLAGIRIAGWYRTIGVGAWLTLGIVALGIVILGFLGLISSLFFPLVVAAVVAAIAVPVVDRAERIGLPRWLGQVLLLLVVVAVVVGIVALVVSGIVSQTGASAIERLPRSVSPDRSSRSSTSHRRRSRASSPTCSRCCSGASWVP